MKSYTSYRCFFHNKDLYMNRSSVQKYNHVIYSFFAPTVFISFIMLNFVIHYNIFSFLKCCYGFPSFYWNELVTQKAFILSKSMSHCIASRHYCVVFNIIFLFYVTRKLRPFELVSFSIEIMSNVSFMRRGPLLFWNSFCFSWGDVTDIWDISISYIFKT